MGCSSCGQRAAARDAVNAALAANQPSQPKVHAQYTIFAPDGSSKTFSHAEYGSDAYLEAVKYKRQVNGTLTTQ